jgi:hypothetical protein
MANTESVLFCRVPMKTKERLVVIARQRGVSINKVVLAELEKLIELEGPEPTPPSNVLVYPRRFQ